RLPAGLSLGEARGGDSLSDVPQSVSGLVARAGARSGPIVDLAAARRIALGITAGGRAGGRAGHESPVGRRDGLAAGPDDRLESGRARPGRAGRPSGCRSLTLPE